MGSDFVPWNLVSGLVTKYSLIFQFSGSASLCYNLHKQLFGITLNKFWVHQRQAPDPTLNLLGKLSKKFRGVKSGVQTSDRVLSSKEGWSEASVTFWLFFSFEGTPKKGVWTNKKIGRCSGCAKQLQILSQGPLWGLSVSLRVERWAWQ